MSTKTKSPHIGQGPALLLRLQRLWFQVLGVFAPDQAEAKALALFARPVPLRKVAWPTIAGAPAHPFTIPFRAGTLAGWDWGAGPTVVLTHGWSGHSGQLGAFIAPLVRAGFHVVAFDHPAHGHSSGQRSDMFEFRDALLAVTRRVGPIHAVIGHSLGATATVLATARGLKIARMVLIAPPADPKPFAQAFAAHIGLTPARTRGLLDRLEALLVADLGENFTLAQIVGTTAIPALIVHDRDDQAVPVANSHALRAAWSKTTHAHLLETEGLGHRRLLQAPDVLYPTLAFLAAPAGAALQAAAGKPMPVIAEPSRRTVTRPKDKRPSV